MPLLDLWSAATFKKLFQNRNYITQLPVANLWTYPHQRRLLAYSLIQSYIDTTARLWMENPDSDHREYGDAALIVEQSVAAVLGATQR